MKSNRGKDCGQRKESGGCSDTVREFLKVSDRTEVKNLHIEADPERPYLLK